MKKKGLGRGLEALLGGDAAELPAAAAGETGSLPLASLDAGRYQPRTRMDEGALAELAESIRAQGVMQPVLVRAKAGGRYEIIAGERRVRAAALAGLAEIPVLVRDVPDASAAVMALIENMQREDLSALEEAQGVQRLIGEFGLTHEAAAAAIGRSRSATTNLLRLLNLAKPVQTMLEAGDLEMGHARALLALDAATQISVANEGAAKRLSVRETERRGAQQGRGPAPRARRVDGATGGDVARLETELSDRLATRVEIRMRGTKKGELAIAFADLDQLDGILAVLRGPG